MKIKTILLIAIIIMVTLTGCSRRNNAEQQMQDVTSAYITIVNNTENTIWYVYVSEATEDSWGPDLLADDQVLLNGESFSYQLPHLISRVDTYDIRLTDSQGDDYIKWSEKVRAGSRIEFTMSDIDIDRFLERTQQ